MPVYLLKRNLFIDATNEDSFIYAKGSILGLHELSEVSREELVKGGSIRLLETPEWAYFEPLLKYGTLMTDFKVATLGDFAGLNRTELPEELQALQITVLDLLNPATSSTIEDCCGESKTSYPIIKTSTPERTTPRAKPKKK